MSLLGPVPPPVSAAVGAAGSLSTGTAERTAKLDAAAHSLAAAQRDLAPQRLDGDPNASPDRDADGWTGGTDTGNPRHDPDPEDESSAPAPARLRLPDDPRGGTLDVTA